MRSCSTILTASISTSPSRWRREAGLEVDGRDTTCSWRTSAAKRERPQEASLVSAVQGDLPPTDDSPKLQGCRPAAQGAGLDLGQQGANDRQLLDGAETGLLLDNTYFYAEQGGQVGDVGVITTPTGSFEVEDTQKLGDSVMHVGRVIERLDRGRASGHAGG